MVFHFAVEEPYRFLCRALTPLSFKFFSRIVFFQNSFNVSFTFFRVLAFNVFYRRYTHVGCWQQISLENARSHQKKVQKPWKSALEEFNVLMGLHI